MTEGKKPQERVPSIRHGKVPGAESHLTRVVASGGAGVRYYVVPRYFVEAEARMEAGGDSSGVVGGVGMGVHLGR